MAWTTTRRLFAALAVAILAGLLLTLIVFVLSLFYVLIVGHTTHIPGLIDFVSDDTTMSVQPADSISITFAVLALLSFPLTWHLFGKIRRR